MKKILLIARICSVILLTTNSIAWAKEINELLIVRGDNQYPPYEMIIDNKLVGFHIDIVTEIALILKIKITYESIPWKRAILMLKYGEADAITYISKTLERENFIYFYKGNILSETKSAFIALKDKEKEIEYTGNHEDLRSYTILVLRGFHYGKSFDKIRFKKKYKMNNWERLPKLIMSKKYDLAIVDVQNFIHTYNQTDFYKETTFLHPPVSTLSYYIGFSKAKGHEQLAKKFSKTLELFKKTAKYDSLLKKYDLE